MACNVDTILANAAASGIGGLTSRTALLQVIAQFSSSSCSAPPAAPVMLGPDPTGEANYDLNWTASTGATGYLWDLGEPPDFAVYIFQDEPAPLPGVFVSDVANASRMCRVRAVNACGISAYSNTVSFFTVAVPDAPVAIAAGSVGTTSFVANWTAPPQAVTSYRIDVSTSAVFASFVGVYNNLDVGSTLFATVAGLTVNTTYYYRVRAVNAAGTSSSSNVITTATAYVMDSFDSYAVAAPLSGLNGGTSWSAAYVNRTNFLVSDDSFDSYSIGADLNGLNAGANWSAAYVSRAVFFVAIDSFDSYTIGASLDGLNGGTNWDAAYVSRP